MEYFDNTPSLDAKFPESAEKDFFIRQIGYNNFNFVAPQYSEYIKPSDTIHFVLSGKGRLNLYNKSYNLGKYDMFYIPKNTPVSYYPDPEDPWVYIWFEFSGDGGNIYVEKLSFSKESPTVKCKRGLDTEKEIIDVFSHLNNNEMVGYYSALALFYKIIDICSVKSDSTQSLSRQIISYLQLHYHNPSLQISEVGEIFGVTHSVLCKTFKKEQNKTVIETLTEIRIKAAETLLRKSHLSVEEVGLSVGYSDKFHFMKTFKKYTGISAGNYRKSYKE